MAAAKSKPELVAIVGPTASGKSELALKIAQEFNGEIIAADSRTIYKGMDIGTAKPSKKEQTLVKHWGLDLVYPGEDFSAYKFMVYAKEKIEQIRKRGSLPVLVGGTGLYIDALLFDFEFADTADPKERLKLESMTVAQLQELIKNSGYELPENHKNKRHLTRTMERKGKTGTKRRLKNNILIIGLMPEIEVLKRRIHKRSMTYFENGLLEETKDLLQKYDAHAIGKTQGIAYIASVKVAEGEINAQEAIATIQKKEWQYARRQRTWFRRNKFIRWFGSVEEAHRFVRSILNN